jgi:4-aminobutyrate aminotransferase-like enzyme
VNRRVYEQLVRLQHVSRSSPRKPSPRWPAKSLHHAWRAADEVLFTNSGTEANETAILAARCATGSSEIVALRHAYHGRSTLGMTLTGQSVWWLAGWPKPALCTPTMLTATAVRSGLTYRPAK